MVSIEYICINFNYIFFDFIHYSIYKYFLVYFLKKLKNFNATLFSYLNQYLYQLQK